MGRRRVQWGAHAILPPAQWAARVVLGGPPAGRGGAGGRRGGVRRGVRERLPRRSERSRAPVLGPRRRAGGPPRGDARRVGRRRRVRRVRHQRAARWLGRGRAVDRRRRDRGRGRRPLPGSGTRPGHRPRVGAPRSSRRRIRVHASRAPARTHGPARGRGHRWRRVRRARRHRGRIARRGGRAGGPAVDGRHPARDRGGARLPGRGPRAMVELPRRHEGHPRRRDRPTLGRDRRKRRRGPRAVPDARGSRRRLPGRRAGGRTAAHRRRAARRPGRELPLDAALLDGRRVAPARDRAPVRAGDRARTTVRSRTPGAGARDQAPGARLGARGRGVTERGRQHRGPDGRVDPR